jgi:hypothetical protein
MLVYIVFTLWLFNIAMGNGPFIDDIQYICGYLPIGKWRFSIECEIARGILFAQDNPKRFSLQKGQVWCLAEGCH